MMLDAQNKIQEEEGGTILMGIRADREIQYRISYHPRWLRGIRVAAATASKKATKKPRKTRASTSSRSTQDE
ncbi:hypothetical protein CVM73_30305 [Bradyrhizobium forestalis]|uniref:Uncharacterized protein n=1 Tax=Bradyrhizobium forestalis TaxID=1419263 RepID=A0A2M8R128_9BRAD|nr:hypothetical protein CVM73_30305 [Bradyrhizobium forestalis]